MLVTITKDPLPLSKLLENNDSFDPCEILIHIDEQMKMENENQDFGSYLNALMKNRYISISDLSDLTGYSELLIIRLLYNFDVEHENECIRKYVFCISIALRLEYSEFEALTKRAGFKINDNYNWEAMINRWIMKCYNKEEVNTIIINECLMFRQMMPLLPNYAAKMLQYHVL